MDNDKQLLKNFGLFLFGYIGYSTSNYSTMKSICAKEAQKKLKLMLMNADALGVGDSLRNELTAILKLHGLSFGR